MDCEKCEGACCEYFGLRVEDLRLPSTDVLRWVQMHGKREGAWILFEQPCQALMRDGRCGIYEDRPQACRDMPPGGARCLEAVRDRRTAEEYVRIRGEGDPEPGEIYA